MAAPDKIPPTLEDAERLRQLSLQNQRLLHGRTRMGEDSLPPMEDFLPTQRSTADEVGGILGNVAVVLLVVLVAGVLVAYLLSQGGQTP